jgi:hypothetical protein
MVICYELSAAAVGYRSFGCCSNCYHSGLRAVWGPLLGIDDLQHPEITINPDRDTLMMQSVSKA